MIQRAGLHYKGEGMDRNENI